MCVRAEPARGPRDCHELIVTKREEGMQLVTKARQLLVCVLRVPRVLRVLRVLRVPR